jgi:hypothetical protein
MVTLPAPNPLHGVNLAAEIALAGFTLGSVVLAGANADGALRSDDSEATAEELAPILAAHSGQPTLSSRSAGTMTTAGSSSLRACARRRGRSTPAPIPSPLRSSSALPPCCCCGR